jgi:hypothetical protein
MTSMEKMLVVTFVLLRKMGEEGYHRFGWETTDDVLEVFTLPNSTNRSKIIYLL